MMTDGCGGHGHHADCHPPYYGQASGPGAQGLSQFSEPKGLCSAKSASGGSKTVLVVETEENGLRLHHVEFSAAVSRRWLRGDGGRRIRNPRPQGHMRSPAIVVLGPCFQ